MDKKRVLPKTGERPSQKHDDCDCCGFETLLSPYRKPFHIEEFWMKGERDRDFDFTDEYPWSWYCDLCAGTYASNTQDHPGNPDSLVLKSMCYIANAIIEEIRKSRPE